MSRSYANASPASSWRCRSDEALHRRATLHGIRDDWVGMADERKTDAGSETPEQPRRSVLSELPRGRPQRASRRREAARERARSEDGANPLAADSSTPEPGAATHARTAEGDGSARRGQTRRSGGSRPGAAKRKSAPAERKSAPAKATAAKRPARSQKSRQAGGPREREQAPPQGERAPRQGYETEEQISGTPVTPPSGVEMIGSLAELAADLAQSGVAAGGRLLKGAISRISDS